LSTINLTEEAQCRGSTFRFTHLIMHVFSYFITRFMALVAFASDMVRLAA
jgi:hypothetical protein